MTHKLVDECEKKMQARVKSFESDLAKTRTGRASVHLVDRVRVEYYGNPTPLSQVANVTTPDARTIVIAPFDKSILSEIEKGVMRADLGLSPTNDGNIIRLPVPALTEDRRKDIAKGLKKQGEEAKVAIRQCRKDANDSAKNLEKSKELSEDEGKRLLADVQKITDKFIKVIDEKVSLKEKEVLTV